ncbi:MAG: lactate utilization protein [Gammaproteobacteria bacterium]
MTEAREAILTSIRHSLGRKESRTGLDGEQRSSESVGGTLGAPVRPAVDGDCVAHFARRITGAGASLVRLESLEAVPEAVRVFLDELGLGHNLVCSGEGTFDTIPWPDGFTVSVRTAADGDHTTLTGVVAAVAETGSLVVASAHHSPNTLHFLPENHIAVVRVSQVLRHLEDVWRLMRERSEGMPRALTFITGPSRTADVEQTIQIGAHGPRRLHVVLVDA